MTGLWPSPHGWVQAWFHHPDDLDVVWDGTEPNDNVVAPSGTYYWILIYKTEALKKASKDGTITLLK